VQNDLRHTTPIDMFLMLTSGKGRTPEEMHATPERWAVLPKNHPVFRDTLGRDDRWAAVFYTRYLAGDGDIHYTLGGGKKMNREDIASVFGGNCAVCHGKKGNGEGTLYTGHPPGHELAVSPVHGGLFYPPPANFTSANRLYNRTDAQLFKYIAEGIYPSAMPPWMGKVDKAGGFTFDDPMIWNLVRHIRSFGYQDDLGLSEDQVPKAGTPAASAVGARGTSGEITGHATRPELAPATKATPTDVSEGSAQVEATAPSPAKAGQTANPSQSKAGGEAARSGGAKR
jgi:hypothetical protein